MTLISTPNFRRVKNYILPPVDERMRTAFAVLDFSVTSLVEYDLSYADNDGAGIVVQSITVDNSDNDAAVDIVSDKALQFSRRVNAGELRVFNIPAIDPSYLSFASLGSGTAKIYLHNFPSIPDSQFVDPALSGGVSPSYAQTAPAVGVASAQVLAANIDRRYLLIQNNDLAGFIYVGFGAAATVANLRIPPGGSFELNGNAAGQAINLIGDVVNANVVVIEG